MSRELTRRRYKVLDTKVIVVAVEGGIHDWACYIGAVQGINHDKEWQKVYTEGSKLPKAVALVLFPDFADLTYRE